jgi:anaerobic ribonucleoside-triphosphate reductase
MMNLKKINHGGTLMNNNNINTVKIPCEIYSRVSGYYRPVKQFNRGKQEEFRMRREFKLDPLPENNTVTI